MSFWTYINGTITVEPMGRTQHEKEYILKTVLDHLPLVTGSERDMQVEVICKKGYNSSSSCDEFGDSTNNLVDRYGYHNRKRGWMQVQDSYILVVYGSFRDRFFEQTYREFIKWLCRLAKRIDVKDVLVQIDGYDKKEIITNGTLKNGFKTKFGQMFEEVSWCNDDGEPNWCEYLMWDKAKGDMMPLILKYKQYEDAENDIEAERRMSYRK